MKLCNIFNFAVMVATLSVGFMLGGCGDSGSTTPNPLNGTATPIPPTPPAPSPPPIQATNQVIFDYSVLASDVMGKTDISAPIAKVRYAFKVSDEQKGDFVDIKETYAGTFEYKNQTHDQQVIVKEVNTEAVKVTAAYYDINDELVALGINDLEWDKNTKNAHVQDPQVLFLGSDPTIGLNVSSYLVPKNGQTRLTFTVTPEGKEAVDMTAFTSFSDMDENILASVIGQPGLFTGINYSGDDGILPTAAIGKKLKITAEQPIYVTDQEIASIKIRPADIEGKQITVEDKNGKYAAAEGRQYFRMYYTDDKTNYANQNVLHMTNTKGKGEGEYTAAVNDQPMQVWAAYSTVPEKGPTPPDVDITDNDGVSIEHKYEASATDYMSVEGKVIRLKSINDPEANLYSVSAKWKEFTSEALTVTVVDAFNEAYLYFVNKDTGAPIIDEIKYSGAGEDSYNMYLAAGVMSIDSSTYDFYRSDMVDIPTAWIRLDQYPDVKAVTLSPTAISEYKQESLGSNSYILKIAGAPAAKVELDIDRPIGATYPVLHQTAVAP